MIQLYLDGLFLENKYIHMAIGCNYTLTAAHDTFNLPSFLLLFNWQSWQMREVEGAPARRLAETSSRAASGQARG
jgi:hypothetical protein